MIDSELQGIWVMAYNYARKSNLSPEDAEDVAQTVTVKVSQREQKGGVRSLEHYTRRVVRTTVVDYWRTQNARPKTVPLGGDLVDAATTRNRNLVVESAEDTGVRSVTLQSALQSLSSRQREITLMHIYGLDNHEIAERLGTKPSNVSSHIGLGTRRLEHALEIKRVTTKSRRNARRKRF